MIQIPVLFTRSDSIYKKLGCDCYDKLRDARNYCGKFAVIAHPPCRSWGRLSHMAKPDPDEHELALFAIDIIQKNGGILEHPRSSKLFPDHLPLPGQIDSFDGFTIYIDQFWYGHKARKRTLLYIVGCKISDLPSIPLRFDAIEYIIGSGKNKHAPKRPEISKADRERTPEKLALWMIETIQIIERNKKTQQLKHPDFRRQHSG